MKKLLSVLLVAAMAVSLCACGGNASNEDTSGATGTDAAESADDATDDAATADTAADAESEDVAQTEDESAPAGSGVMPAIAKEDLKIGVIHITDPAEGSGYTYTHDLGIQGMQKNLGLEDSQIVRKNNVKDRKSVV